LVTVIVYVVVPPAVTDVTPSVIEMPRSVGPSAAADVAPSVITVPSSAPAPTNVAIARPHLDPDLLDVDDVFSDVDFDKWIIPLPLRACAPLCLQPMSPQGTHSIHDAKHFDLLIFC
jgi:hypothetical protein